jgi:hypothetical protein
MELQHFERNRVIQDAKILLRTQEDGKHFAIGVIDSMTYQNIGRYYWRRSNREKRSKDIYIIFWGNTDVLENMGIKPVLTESGQVAKQSTAFKNYFDMIKVSKGMEFKQ